MLPHLKKKSLSVSVSLDLGQSVGPYAPEPISLGGDAKSSGKYGNIKWDIRIICLCTTEC